jgi:PTH1 family peptidyl-tRNA hydrolase
MQIDYVLGRFTDEQLQQLQPSVDVAVDIIKSFVLSGIDFTMNQYNKLGKRPSPNPSLNGGEELPHKE